MKNYFGQQWSQKVFCEWNNYGLSVSFSHSYPFPHLRLGLSDRNMGRNFMKSSPTGLILPSGVSGRQCTQDVFTTRGSQRQARSRKVKTESSNSDSLWEGRRGAFFTLMDSSVWSGCPGPIQYVIMRFPALGCCSEFELEDQSLVANNLLVLLHRNKTTTTFWYCPKVDGHNSQIRILGLLFTDSFIWIYQTRSAPESGQHALQRATRPS